MTGWQDYVVGEAINMLFDGQNIGKLLIKVDPPEIAVPAPSARLQAQGAAPLVVQSAEHDACPPPLQPLPGMNP